MNKLILLDKSPLADRQACTIAAVLIGIEILAATVFMVWPIMR